MIWSAETAERIARDALGQLRVPHVGLRPVRAFNNAVFEVPGSDWLLRIPKLGGDTVQADVEVRLGRHLLTQGLAVPRPLTDPLHLHGTTATLWEKIEHDPHAPCDLRRLGELACAFHRVAASFPGTVPVHDLCAPNERRIAEARERGLLGRRDLDTLIAELDQFRDALSDLPASLDKGVIHGDIVPWNTLAARDGRTVLIDFERVGVGYLAVDLAAVIAWARRSGDEAKASAFLDGYGAEHDEYLELFVRLRELSFTLSVACHPRHQEETERRLRYWRGEMDPPHWRFPA